MQPLKAQASTKIAHVRHLETQQSQAIRARGTGAAHKREQIVGRVLFTHPAMDSIFLVRCVSMT
jgi:hypothetical protein